MTEENFEKFLRKTAQGYNAPPVRVPRDEMWAAIRSKRAPGPRVVYGGGVAGPWGRHETWSGTRVWLGVAAAAMVLVAAGAGIGRWTAAKPARTSVAATPTLRGRAVVAVPEAGEAAGATAGTQIATATPRSGTGPAQRATALPGIDSPRESVVSRTAASPNPSTNNVNSAYQLTAVQYLSEAEALLTSFRARSTPDQQMDAQLGAWARQLLTNTRLLLDSPIADDPRRRPLLEDLELVLVQIVQQLSPAGTPQDRELIERTLEQDQVMTKLRTAIPAGAQRGS